MKKKENRKTISALTSSSISLDYMTLEELQKQTEELIALYGKEATIKKTTFPYDDGEYFYVYENRLENDEEYNKRLAYERELMEMQEKRELAEFERLSKKFGKS